MAKVGDSKPSYPGTLIGEFHYLGRHVEFYRSGTLLAAYFDDVLQYLSTDAEFLKQICDMMEDGSGPKHQQRN